MPSPALATIDQCVDSLGSTVGHTHEIRWGCEREIPGCLVAVVAGQGEIAVFGGPPRSGVVRLAERRNDGNPRLRRERDRTKACGNGNAAVGDSDGEHFVERVRAIERERAEIRTAGGCCRKSRWHTVDLDR